MAPTGGRFALKTRQDKLAHKKRGPLKRASSGDEGARTPNPRLAKAVLSQLSYVPLGIR